MSQESTNIVFEKFDASEWKVGFVVAGFNKDINDLLLDTAQKCLADYKIPAENVTINYVAGAVEIPLILKKMAESWKYRALVCIGTIIRGDTAHFDYVAKAVTEGMMRVQLDHSIPVGFGVLTLENKSQAEVRIPVGYSATEAALQSAKIIEKI